ncbi:hypothetical protein [Solimicrobium silvestre]|uniref:Uncharacterized protein n=1 Tax=Solimicrobium silvestre TaxID=2099400 RepID=A0A2S9H5K5_9BURK|nr:hypothetical protein [Solimicrobium silvestre]PRC95262.1 hypothetical protein S2091_0457 [Solimicrobium silvestre]
MKIKQLASFQGEVVLFVFDDIGANWELVWRWRNVGRGNCCGSGVIIVEGPAIVEVVNIGGSMILKKRGLHQN